MLVLQFSKSKVERNIQNALLLSLSHVFKGVYFDLCKAKTRMLATKGTFFGVFFRFPRLLLTRRLP